MCRAQCLSSTLYRSLVSTPGHGARVLPLEPVPHAWTWCLSSTLGASACARAQWPSSTLYRLLVSMLGHGARVPPLELVPVPGHSA